MAFPKYADLILFKLTRESPECDKTFEKVIRDLADRDSTLCPTCGTAVDLIGHKRAIKDYVELTTELDKFPRE